MLQEILSIGDKIDVKELDHTGKAMNHHVYASMLLDIIDEDIISISMPLGNGGMIFLDHGDRCNLCFYTKKGLYQCSGEMAGRYQENNAIIAKLRLISNLEKLQRRQYFRLECIHEIKYRVITGEEQELEYKLSLGSSKNAEEHVELQRKLSEMDKSWQKASIIDLSGGGARFNSDFIHNTGDKIRMKLDFVISNELKKLVLGAVIISTEKLSNRSGKYEHRVEFNDIGKKDREDLIKYIFEQDRRRRKKT